MKYYLKTHEWIEESGDVSDGKKLYRMGISKYACDQLGDIVFIEAKDTNNEYSKGESLAILESVKAVGDIYAPFDCKLSQINSDLVDAPESLNDGSWVVEVEAVAVDLAAYDEILAEDKYLATI